MKKHLFISALLLVASLASGQVGVNTDTPTQTLDVNGTARIRTLSDLPSPNANSVVTRETDGTLRSSSATAVMYSSGLYTRSSPNGNWSGILTGSKSARLDFCGRYSGAFGLDFTFSVFYDVGSGFTVLPGSVVPATVTVTPVSTTSFSILIEGVTYTFTFTSVGSGRTDVQAVPDNGAQWIQGTFVSTPNIS